jgi:hypothetical protein
VLSGVTTLLFYSDTAHISCRRFSLETVQIVSRPKGLPKTGGRQKGAANKRTREIADAAVKEGVTPLEYMLAVLRDETVGPERRDEMAKASAPYIHPRLASVEATVDVSDDFADRLSRARDRIKQD